MSGGSTGGHFGPIDAGTRHDEDWANGAGKYLKPGLAEMYAHLMGGSDALNERILFLNIARGITTIRGMRKGELLGPTIYTSGPSLNGNTVPDAAAGYDFPHRALRAGTANVAGTSPPPIGRVSWP